MSLEQLMQIAPVTGAGFAARKFNTDQQTEALRQQELAGIIAKRAHDMQVAQQEAPLKLEELRLNNRHKGTQIESADLTNRKTRGILDTDIAATNAKNLGSVDSEAEKSRQRAMTFFQEAGAVLADTPTPLRMTALNDLMTQHKIDPNNKLVRAVLSQAQADPENFPKRMLGLADRLGQLAASQNPQYRQGVDVANINANRGIEVAKIQERSAKYTADKNHDARVEVAQAQAAAKTAAQQQAKTMEALAAQYLRQANELPDGDPRKGELRARAAQAIQAAQYVRSAALQGRPDPEGFGVPTLDVPNPLASDDQPVPAPKAGQVIDGYKFKGGNPNDPNNWEKAN